MITPQHVVNIVLDEAAKNGRADETMVLVTDKSEATLRWANNSMTTNGVTVTRTVTVISVVRQGDSVQVGSVVSGEVDPRVLPGLVVSSQDAARSAPEAGDAAPLLADSGEPADWDAPVPGTGVAVFSGITGPLSKGFRAADRLYGYAHHSVSTTLLASSTGCGGATPSPPGRSRSTPNAVTPAPGPASAAPISLTCLLIRCCRTCRRGLVGPRVPSNCPPGGTRRSCRPRQWRT